MTANRIQLLLPSVVTTMILAVETTRANIEGGLTTTPNPIKVLIGEKYPTVGCEKVCIGPVCDDCVGHGPGSMAFDLGDRPTDRASTPSG